MLVQLLLWPWGSCCYVVVGAAISMTKMSKWDKELQVRTIFVTMQSLVWPYIWVAHKWADEWSPLEGLHIIEYDWHLPPHFWNWYSRSHMNFSKGGNEGRLASRYAIAPLSTNLGELNSFDETWYQGLWYAEQRWILGCKKSIGWFLDFKCISKSQYGLWGG